MNKRGKKMNYNNNGEYNKYDDNKYDYNGQEYDPSYDNGAAPEVSMFSPEEIKKAKKRVNKRLGCLIAVLTFPIWITGIMMLIGGTSSLISYYHAKGHCTELVIGEIESIDTWVHHNSREDGGDSVGFAPVYSYEYNGKPYIKKESAYSSEPEFSEGDEVEIYVDPDDPTTIFVPSYKKNKDTSVAFTVAGGGITLVFALLIFNAGRLMVRKESDMD